MFKPFALMFLAGVFVVNAAAVLMVFVEPAYAAGGRCCTGVDNVTCSGCIAAGAGFINIGTNPIYFCEDYVNPLTCDDTGFMDCFTITAPMLLYEKNDCKKIIGVQNPPGTLAAKQCPQDSCD